jgi:hypothetical protein
MLRVEISLARPLIIRVRMNGDQLQGFCQTWTKLIQFPRVIASE